MGDCFFLGTGTYIDHSSMVLSIVFPYVHGISIVLPWWYFHGMFLVETSPWSKLHEFGKTQNICQQITSITSPSGFCAFHGTEKFMDFFKWRSPKPIKSEQSMDILHYFAWFYISLPLPTRFAPRGHLIYQCHLTVNFVALQNCHLLPLFCVDATNIQKKKLKDVIFDVFLMKDDFCPILITDHHFS